MVTSHNSADRQHASRNQHDQAVHPGNKRLNNHVPSVRFSRSMAMRHGNIVAISSTTAITATVTSRGGLSIRITGIPHPKPTQTPGHHQSRDSLASMARTFSRAHSGHNQLTCPSSCSLTQLNTASLSEVSWTSPHRTHRIRSSTRTLSLAPGFSVTHAIVVAE